MNQKEAVYQAVVAITGFDGVGVCEPTSEQTRTIRQVLFEGFRNGSIELRKEYTDKELSNYVSGLLNNWLRKDKRLNGGVDHQPKSSRVDDPQLTALRALLSTITDPTDRAEIQRHIDSRIAELNRPKVDFSKLPAEIAAKFGKR